MFLIGTARPPPVNWSLINEAAFIRCQSRRVNHLAAAVSGQPAGGGGGVISRRGGLQTQHLLGPDVKSSRGIEGRVGVRGARHAVGLRVIHWLHTFIQWSTGRALIGCTSKEGQLCSGCNAGSHPIWNPNKTWNRDAARPWLHCGPLESGHRGVFLPTVAPRLLCGSTWFFLWFCKAHWNDDLAPYKQYSREEEWFRFYIVIVFVAVELT